MITAPAMAAAETDREKRSAYRVSGWVRAAASSELETRVMRAATTPAASRLYRTSGPSSNPSRRFKADDLTYLTGRKPNRPNISTARGEERKSASFRAASGSVEVLSVATVTTSAEYQDGSISK